jgi:hypothetical protein
MEGAAAVNVIAADPALVPALAPVAAAVNVMADVPAVVA